MDPKFGSQIFGQEMKERKKEKNKCVQCIATNNSVIKREKGLF